MYKFVIWIILASSRSTICISWYKSTYS